MEVRMASGSVALESQGENSELFMTPNSPWAPFKLPLELCSSPWNKSVMFTEMKGDKKGKWIQIALVYHWDNLGSRWPGNKCFTSWFNLSNQSSIFSPTPSVHWLICIFSVCLSPCLIWSKSFVWFIQTLESCPLLQPSCVNSLSWISLDVNLIGLPLAILCVTILCLLSENFIASSWPSSHLLYSPGYCFPLPVLCS